MINRLLGSLAVLACLCGVPERAGAAELTGKLVIVGSDTLAELMTLWSAGFTRQHPAVAVELQAGGSAAAPTALVRGTANVGSMSRPMSPEERSRFVAAKGFEPLEIPVALDTIAVIVHRDNPLPALSLDMIASIFGDNACGNSDAATHWGNVGLEGAWRNRRIEPFGRTLASGTYELFRSIALCGGDPGINVGESPGNASLIDTVANTPGAIGYVGIGFVDERVKVPPLDVGFGDRVSLETMANNASYPFNRTLYLYLPLSGEQQLPTLECEFLRYISSSEGESLLLGAGFLPPVAQGGLRRDEVGCAL